MRNTLRLSLLLLLGACGEVASFTDAGNTGDDTIDAATTPDATSVGPVTVTALTRCCTNPNDPVQGVEVISVDPDGNGRDRAQTSVQGQATVDVERGGSVTVIYPNTGNSHYLVTIAAVDPGDDLTFGDRFTESTGNPPTTMRVTWPAQAGISYFYVYTNCGGFYVPVGTSTETVVSQYEYCVAATTDFIIVAYDVNGVNRFARMDNVAWNPAAVASFPSVASTPTTFTVAMGGLGPEITSASIEAYPINGTVTLPGAYAGGAPTGGMVTGQGSWIGAPDGALGYYYLYRDGNFGSQYGSQRIPANPTEFRINTATTLPWVSRDIAANAAARVVTWIQVGDTPYDHARVELDWYRSLPVFGTGGTIYYDWDIYLPPGITTLEFPAMPAALEQHAPPPDFNFYPSVRLTESEAYDGWAAVKAAPEWDLECPNCVPLDSASYPTTRYSDAGGGK